MLFVRDLSLAFGGRQLFDGLNWTVRAGDRVGLVGPNGAGKSTLLRVIAGEQRPDGGEVVREAQATVGYLRQDTQEQDTGASPLDEALHAFDDVKRLALTVVVELAVADGEDLALLRLLLGRVRQDDAGSRGRFLLDGLDDQTIAERLELH